MGDSERKGEVTSASERRQRLISQQIDQGQGQSMENDIKILPRGLRCVNSVRGAQFRKRRYNTAPRRMKHTQLAPSLLIATQLPDGGNNKKNTTERQ